MIILFNNDADNWASTHLSDVVSQMLRFGGVPAVLSNELITCLKENDDISGLQKLIQQDMSPGDKIVIINGPFEGYINNRKARHV